MNKFYKLIFYNIYLIFKVFIIYYKNNIILIINLILLKKNYIILNINLNKFILFIFVNYISYKK